LRFETVEAADVSRQVFMVKRREKRAESGGREKERRREGEKERRREGEKERAFAKDIRCCRQKRSCAVGR